jgi:hypothetical protein
MTGPLEQPRWRGGHFLWRPEQHGRRAAQLRKAGNDELAKQHENVGQGDRGALAGWRREPVDRARRGNPTNNMTLRRPGLGAYLMPLQGATSGAIGATVAPQFLRIQ